MREADVQNLPKSKVPCFTDSPVLSLILASGFFPLSKPQLKRKPADNKDMRVANVGMTHALVNLASGMQTSKVQSEIGVAVLKSIQDQQKVQAEALLAMMRQMSGLNGSGQIVNISV